MKNINKRTIVLSLIAAVLCFIIALAVICPNIKLKTLDTKNSFIGSTKPADAEQIVAGEISPEGKITVNKEIGYTVLQFDAKEAAAKFVEINFLSIKSKNTRFVIERTNDGTYKDLTPVDTTLAGSEINLVMPLGDEACSSVRIWFYTDCQVENVALHSQEPIVVINQLRHSPWRYALVVLISAAAFAAVMFADKKFDASGKIVEKIKLKQNSILKTLTASAIGVLLGALTEVVYRAWRGADVYGSMFNKANFFAFSAFYILIAIFITQRKNLMAAPEKAVAMLIFTFSTLLALTLPFAHMSWDCDTHYTISVKSSFVGKAYLSEADILINGPTKPFVYNAEHDNAAAISQLNQLGEAAIRETDTTFSLAHLPAGLFLAVARLFGANLFTRYFFGRMANVILYSIICYFAIKRLKTGKMLVSIIALFPTNLLVAANFSYDWWVTAFVLLGTAYFISELQQPDKKMTVRETVIMCASFMLASLPKLIYVMTFALPLFMFKNYKTKREKINYYAIWTAFFVVTLLLFAATSLKMVTGTGDTRGGAVNPSAQISFILHQPFRYTEILLDFLKEYLSIEEMRRYICNLCGMDIVGSASVFAVLLLFTAFTDKQEHNTMHKYAIITRIASLLLLFGGAALIATALYIDFNPVASETINGCQPRYIIPIIAPALLLLYGPKVTIKNRMAYNTVILGIIAVMTWHTIVEGVVKVVN